MVATPFVSVREAGELLGISLVTVRRLIARGVIPAVRVGRQFRIDLRRLDRELGDASLQPVAPGTVGPLPETSHLGVTQ